MRRSARRRRSAEQATAILSGRPYLVTTAALDRGGQIRLECTEGLRLEVFPDVAGPIECWRLFVKGSDNHYTYESGRKPRQFTD